MICNVSELEKAFPDKDMRDFYVMYHWNRCLKTYQKDGKVFVAYRAQRERYSIPVEKVTAFEKNGVFVRL